MFRAVLAGLAGGALAAALLQPTAPAAGDDVPPYQDPNQPTSVRVADLLGRMTLADKVGQMTQAERADITDPQQITDARLGSVLSGGGSVPTPNTAEAWADMVDSFQEAALATPLGIPLLYGVDSVHGHGNLQGATVFPHNIGLGATRDPKLVERIGRITAEETRSSGPQWVFAPCICVARDDRWGRTYESFGETPSLVESMETIIDGLQHGGETLATAKHFAGDGLTAYDASKAGTGAYPIDQGVDRVSRAEFDRLALAPYWPAVQKHHVGSVMPSFSSTDFNGGSTDDAVKMHANHELLTDVLKGEMGFDGFVISDWQAIRQLPGTYAEQVATAVNAGVDMFMEPYSGSDTGYREFIDTLTGLVQDGTVSEDRIDDAVSRILTAKFDLGLFEHPMTDRSKIDQIGSRAHHAVARRAAAESQVLLRNKQHTLPLRRKADVYVAGSNADSIGNQAGGWTLTWQGDSSNVIPGTTIRDGIERLSHGHVTYSETASAPIPRKAVGVVVVGETPYAEGMGDVGGPQGQTMELSQADRHAITKVCARTTACTVLVVSGRPVIIPPRLLHQTDALVASWLPGSEGIGVADVLFGRARFTGRLPVSWPRSLAQEPINVGDAHYDPLYPYGFGLRAR
jgi:beta-glucosidase